MKMKDLGMPCCTGPELAVNSEKKPDRPSYPNLYIRSKEDLGLPDGEFTAMIKCRMIKSAKETRDPEKPEYTCEIEVQSIGEAGEKPATGAAMIKNMLRKKLGKGAVEDDEGEE